MMIKRIFLSFLFLTTILVAVPAEPPNHPFFPQEEKDQLPVQFKGRVRPYSEAAALWLEEITERDFVKPSKFASFHALTPEDFLWKVLLYGPMPWRNTHLFYLSPEIKKNAHVKFDRKRYSLLEVQNIENLPSSIRGKVQIFIRPPVYLIPLKKPIGHFGELSILGKGENNTLYSDERFQKLQELYLKGVESEGVSFAIVQGLIQGYSEIPKEVKEEIFRTSGVFFPTFFQLWLEAKLFAWPVEVILALFYAAAALLLLLLKRGGGYVFLGAFLAHTLLLALRVYLLQRPPVSNMEESLLYVPWSVALFGLLFYLAYREKKILTIASATSAFLLGGAYFTDLLPELETIPAVLNSNYWLTIHVLLVVGSYALFILAGVIGNVQAVRSLFNKEIQERALTPVISLLYTGTILLAAGTLLGGVWAAESWGRFWGWDPKESWAFISIITYLIIIHAHKFKYIGSYGLMVGTIVGLMIITFTWYGVNYLIGSGLHSYGFGVQDSLYYFIFLGVEFLLLLLLGAKSLLQKRK